jgi:hypothetical protein
MKTAKIAISQWAKAGKTAGENSENGYFHSFHFICESGEDSDNGEDDEGEDSGRKQWKWLFSQLSFRFSDRTLFSFTSHMEGFICLVLYKDEKDSVNE